MLFPKQFRLPSFKFAINQCQYLSEKLTAVILGLKSPYVNKALKTFSSMHYTSCYICNHRTYMKHWKWFPQAHRHTYMYSNTCKMFNWTVCWAMKVWSSITKNLATGKEKTWSKMLTAKNRHRFTCNQIGVYKRCQKVHNIFAWIYGLKKKNFKTLIEYYTQTIT